MHLEFQLEARMATLPPQLCTWITGLPIPMKYVRLIKNSFNLLSLTVIKFTELVLGTVLPLNGITLGQHKRDDIKQMIQLADVFVYCLGVRQWCTTQISWRAKFLFGP